MSDVIDELLSYPTAFQLVLVTGVYIIGLMLVEFIDYLRGE